MFDNLFPKLTEMKQLNITDFWRAFKTGQKFKVQTTIT